MLLRVCYGNISQRKIEIFNCMEVKVIKIYIHIIHAKTTLDFQNFYTCMDRARS